MPPNARFGAKLLQSGVSGDGVPRTSQDDASGAASEPPIRNGKPALLKKETVTDERTQNERERRRKEPPGPDGQTSAKTEPRKRASRVCGSVSSSQLITAGYRLSAPGAKVLRRHGIVPG